MYWHYGYIMLKGKAQSDDHQADDLLMTSDVSRQLLVSGQRVIQLNREGKLPAIRTANGTRLFRRSDVERLKAERAEKRRA